MNGIYKPTPEELRAAQAALDAVNLAYEYFTPAPWTAVTKAAKSADYLPYSKAA